MTTMLNLSVQGTAWERWSQLRNALDLIAAIREVRDPFGSIEEFRKLLELIVRLAEQFGVDQHWLDRWESLLTDERLAQVVLAIAQYVLGVLKRSETSTVLTGSSLQAVAPQAIVVEARSYAEWLPTVIELLRIVLRLRGEA